VPDDGVPSDEMLPARDYPEVDAREVSVYHMLGCAEPPPPITDDTPPVDGPATAPTGEVRLTGILWPPEHQDVPDTLPGTLRAIDPTVVDAFTPYQIRPSYLVLQSTDPAVGELPVPPEPPELSDGPHLGYAVQWFLFAGVVIVGYPILLHRVARTNRIW
jgi:surfeit locus 1 family protein